MKTSGLGILTQRYHRSIKNWTSGLSMSNKGWSIFGKLLGFDGHCVCMMPKYSKVKSHRHNRRGCLWAFHSRNTARSSSYYHFIDVNRFMLFYSRMRVRTYSKLRTKNQNDQAGYSQKKNYNVWTGLLN